MKVSLYILVIAILLIGRTVGFAQEHSPSDSSAVEQIRRPHILYVELMGRAPFWNIGYGYSFYRYKKHELNTTIGINYSWGGRTQQSTAFLIGTFYRYGNRFCVEVGASAVVNLNWVRFFEEPHFNDRGEHIDIPGHGYGIVPSVGFVYRTKNERIQLGIRYTPLVDLRNTENTFPYMFGAFMNYCF